MEWLELQTTISQYIGSNREQDFFLAIKVICGLFKPFFSFSLSAEYLKIQYHIFQGAGYFVAQLEPYLTI